MQWVFVKSTKGYHVYRPLMENEGVGSTYFRKSWIHQRFGADVPAVFEWTDAPVRVSVKAA